MGAGDRVALWLPNMPAWLALFFACARLGAIAVSVNTRFRSHEVADIVDRSRARLLVFWPGFKDRLRRDPRRLRPAALDTGSGDRLRRGRCAARRRARQAGVCVRRSPAIAPCPKSATPDAGCVIFTTSGTTKAPKFVLHDQRTVIRHAFDVAAGFGIGPDATLLLAPPLCGVFGFCNAMAAIAAHGPS